MEAFATAVVIIPPGESLRWFSDWWDASADPQWAACYEDQQLKITLPEDDVDFLMNLLVGPELLEYCWENVIMPPSFLSGVVLIAPELWTEEIDDPFGFSIRQPMSAVPNPITRSVTVSCQRSGFKFSRK